MTIKINPWGLCNDATVLHRQCPVPQNRLNVKIYIDACGWIAWICIIRFQINWHCLAHLCSTCRPFKSVSEGYSWVEIIFCFVSHGFSGNGFRHLIQVYTTMIRCLLWFSPWTFHTHCAMPNHLNAVNTVINRLNAILRVNACYAWYFCIRRDGKKNISAKS